MMIASISSSLCLAAETKADPFVTSVIIFVLAIFVGFEVITKVPAALHTPLMSGSNAISGITIVGALLCSFSDSLASFGVIFGFLAIIFATINVVGGYVVTNRMLRMFKGTKQK
jgi:NAD(P) transhydrogenase subunit alpha